MRRYLKYADKRGEGYIMTCVAVIIVSMLLSVFIMFANAVNTVNIVVRNSRIVLDGYVTSNAIEIYDSVKQGNDKNGGLDSERYIERLCENRTFVSNENLLYNYDADGNIICYISKPSLGFTKENSLKIFAKYTVYIPIWFSGKMVGTAAVPITVISKYTEKF